MTATPVTEERGAGVRERILCAAIWVDTGKADPPRRSYTYPATGILFCGWRHSDCFVAMNAWERGLWFWQRRRLREQLAGLYQGFLTSRGRYVGHHEAMLIARCRTDRLHRERLVLRGSLLMVYLDDMVDWGKRIGRAGPRWSHMIADTLDELHAMANRIGLRRSWFQKHASMPHYDIGTDRIRALAIAAGAVECDRKVFVEHKRRIFPKRGRFGGAV